MTHKLFALTLLALVSLSLHAQTANTISPSSGSGNSQLFTTTWTDNQGAGGLVNPVDGGAFVILVIGPNVNLSGSNLYPSNSCPVWYNVNTSQLGIVNDAGNSSSSTSIGGGSVSNSQCTLDAAQSTFTNSAPNFTVGFHVTFKSGYTGAKNLYMRIADLIVGGDSGYIQKGSWTVTANPLSITSLTPNSVNATSVPPGNPDPLRLVQLTMTLGDTLGYADITVATIVIANTAPDSNGPPANSCSLEFLASQQAFFLDPDLGGQNWNLDNYIDPNYLDGDVNSQCYAMSYGSVIQGSGNSLALTVNLGFTASFSGTHNVYVSVANSSQSLPFALLGTVTVVAPQGLEITSMIPGTTGGAESFVYTTTEPSEPVLYEVCADDQKGYANLHYLYAGFQPNTLGPPPPGYFNPRFGCWVQYDATVNGFQLLNDQATAWSTAQAPGATWTVQNSQCLLYGQYTQVIKASNTLCNRVEIAWKKPPVPPGSMAFNETARAINFDGLDTGWTQQDYWEVQDPPPGSIAKPFQPISIEPASFVNNGTHDVCVTIYDANTGQKLPEVALSITANTPQRFSGFHPHEDPAPYNRTLYGVNITFPNGNTGESDANGQWCPYMQMPEYSGLYNYSFHCPSCVDPVITSNLGVRHLDLGFTLVEPQPPIIDYAGASGDVVGLPQTLLRLEAHKGLDYFMRPLEVLKLHNIASDFYNYFEAPVWLYRGALVDGGTNDDLMNNVFFYPLVDWHNDGKHFDVMLTRSTAKTAKLKQLILLYGCSYGDVMFTLNRPIGKTLDVKCE